MTIQKTLRRVQYVVNEQGERTAVFLPFEDWETLVAWLNEQSEDEMPEPVQSLDELWGDFWPEDESVDDFIDTVRQWRKDDTEAELYQWAEKGNWGQKRRERLQRWIKRFPAARWGECH